MTNKTLLEILVDELPGLGGWPERALFAEQRNNAVVCFHADCYVTDVKFERLAIDRQTSSVTREQYEQALAENSNKMKSSPSLDELLEKCSPENRHAEIFCDSQQPWNGEGLPPVGTVCTVTPHNTLWGFDSVDEYECEIMAYDGESVWLKYDNYSSTRTDKADFRPIRTPEQIEAERRERVTEKMKKYIEQRMMFSSFPTNAKKLAERFYDDVSAGKIEGVKIDE